MRAKNSSDEKIKQEEAKIDKWFNKADLSADIRDAVLVEGRKGRPQIGRKISITLPDALIAELKQLADKKSIGYQTLIRMIVKENIKKYA